MPDQFNEAAISHSMWCLLYAKMGKVSVELSKPRCCLCKEPLCHIEGRIFLSNVKKARMDYSHNQRKKKDKGTWLRKISRFFRHSSFYIVGGLVLVNGRMTWTFQFMKLWFELLWSSNCAYFFTKAKRLH